MFGVRQPWALSVALGPRPVTSALHPEAPSTGGPVAARLLLWPSHQVSPKKWPWEERAGGLLSPLCSPSSRGGQAQSGTPYLQRCRVRGGGKARGPRSTKASCTSPFWKQDQVGSLHRRLRAVSQPAWLRGQEQGTERQGPSSTKPSGQPQTGACQGPERGPAALPSGQRITSCCPGPAGHRAVPGFPRAPPLPSCSWDRRG